MSTGQDRSHLKVMRFLARNVTNSGRAPCQAGSGFNGQQIWMAGWDSANLNPATPPGLPGLSVPLIAITQRVACRGNLREHDATSTAGGGHSEIPPHFDALSNCKHQSPLCKEWGRESKTAVGADEVYSRVQAVERPLSSGEVTPISQSGLLFLGVLTWGRVSKL